MYILVWGDITTVSKQVREVTYFSTFADTFDRIERRPVVKSAPFFIQILNLVILSKKLQIVRFLFRSLQYLL